MQSATRLTWLLGCEAGGAQRGPAWRACGPSGTTRLREGVPVTARRPFRVASGVQDERRRNFEAEAVGVLPGAQDVVLKLTETKR